MDQKKNRMLFVRLSVNLKIVETIELHNSADNIEASLPKEKPMLIYVNIYVDH
jgi:hypothetical protein